MRIMQNYIKFSFDKNNESISDYLEWIDRKSAEFADPRNETYPLDLFLYFEDEPIDGVDLPNAVWADPNSLYCDTHNQQIYFENEETPHTEILDCMPKIFEDCDFEMVYFFLNYKMAITGLGIFKRENNQESRQFYAFTLEEVCDCADCALTNTNNLSCRCRNNQSAFEIDNEDKAKQFLNFWFGIKTDIEDGKRFIKYHK